jgi:alpha-tubulin suppressor-like RCC1 family protein
LALEDNGTLYSWGVGEKGECGHGKFEDIEAPTKIKFF